MSCYLQLSKRWNRPWVVQGEEKYYNASCLHRYLPDRGHAGGNLHIISNP